MKVSQTPEADRRLYELNLQKRKIIQGREKEIEMIKAAYETQVDNARASGNANLHEVHEGNNKRILDAINANQERLDEYARRMQHDAQLYDEQYNNFSQVKANQIKDLKERFDERLRIDNETRMKYAQDIEDTTSNAINNLKFKVQIEKNRNTAATKGSLDKLEQEHDTKVRDLEMTYKIDTHRKENEYLEKRLDQSKDHEQNLMELKTKQKKELVQLTKGHESTKKILETTSKENILALQNAFEERMKALSKEHEEIIARSKQILQKDLDRLVNEKSAEINLKTDQTQDPFYHVTKLEPVVTDIGKHYVVDLAVPEYEKERVQLSAQDRRLRITMARHFDDVIRDEVGNVNGSRRSEIFTKEVPVEALVNSKKVEQKYENGILSFKIAKL